MTDEEKKLKLEADEKLAKDVANFRPLLKKELEDHDGKVRQEIKNAEQRMIDANTKKEQEYIKDQEAQKKRDKEFEDEMNQQKISLEETKRFTSPDDSKRRTAEQKAQIASYMTYIKESQVGLQVKHDEKTYVISNDPQAGYLQVPPTLATEIIDQAVVEITPAMRLSNTITISGNEWQVPAYTAHAVATRVGETGTTSEDTTLAFGKEFIRVDYMTVLLKASLAQLSDSAFNVEAIFRNQVAQAYNKKVGNEWALGNGSTQMMGITIDPTIVGSNTVNSGSATTLTAGTTSSKGLNGLYWAGKTKYRGNSTWAMRRATMGVAYGLTDGQGQYLLRFGLNQLEGKPVWSIMGSMVEEAPDMPAIAGSAYPIAFGDFKAGYKIVNSSSMTVLRDPYTSKTTNVVEFMYWLRNGGGVVNPESIYLQIIAA